MVEAEIAAWAVVRYQKAVITHHHRAGKSSIDHSGLYAHSSATSARCTLPVGLGYRGRECLQGILMSAGKPNKTHLELEDLSNHIGRFANTSDLIVQFPDFSSNTLASLPNAVDARDEPFLFLRR